MIPHEIEVVFLARWMQGGASVEWLSEHPEWAFWVDVCSTAYELATEDKRRQQEAVMNQPD